jgi:hypothetical protein
MENSGKFPTYKPWVSCVGLDCQVEKVVFKAYDRMGLGLN